METLRPNLVITVNEKIYLKDPSSTELGRRIVSGSIELIHSMGFEAFTFKKLGQSIQSPEASIYRYFESKHKLLLYLTAWYWNWVEYRLLLQTANISDPLKKLEKAVLLLTSEVTRDSDFSHINEPLLYQIVIGESSKAYLTKGVDAENREGCFSGYKQLVERVSRMVLDVNPGFRYPHMLVSTVIEGTHHERFFACHLPRLTDSFKGEDSVSSFFTDMVFKMVKPGIHD